MSNIYNQNPNFKEIAKRENNFNYSVASLGDIYRPYLESPKIQRQYDILSEEEMYAKGLIPGKSNIGYKKYSKSKFPQDPNIKNVNINNVDLGKGLSKNINLNQGKSPGILKGSKIKPQRQSSAISTKKIKYNQEFDPAQKNRIMDVNYLHLTKLPESKKFSHVDKAIINPVQSTFSVKKIVDDNIKRHEKMMKPIVLFPDPVRIYNQQPEKILPGSLRRSQEEIKEFENSNARKNMMVIGQGFGNKNNIRDNHVIFENPKEKKFRRKATSTRLARNTLKKSEKFVGALENYFLSTDLKVPPKYHIKTILNDYAEELEKGLNNFEKEIRGKKGCGTELNLLRLRQRVYDIKKVKTKFTKYLLFIDLKNAYDKVDHKRLFLKLSQMGINEELIGSIKLLYSKAKLKISYNSECINVNNGVLQGSLISPMLFDLYINDLINELDKNSFEVLAYADDLCVLCDGRNQLNNVIKIIDKWSKLNGINVNKNKSGIMILKNDIKEKDNIDGYPIIREYKYLGILINFKMNIQNHIGMINKKLDEYFKKNFILNKRYFSVKSIMLIFGYFHKSRLLYGLPAFIDQKSKIERIDNIMITNIKKLLKLAKRTNTERLKIALGLPDLNTYLIQRLIKLKIKYENIFNEKLTMYDETIKKILNLNDISQVRPHNNYVYNKLKIIGNKEGLDINQGFINRLKHRIYSWYVDSDFLLLKFMCHRGSFREDIYEKCILCKDANNGFIHVVNECKCLEEERKELINKLQYINNTWGTNLLREIEYHYYSVRYSNAESLAKRDNKGISLIKKFIRIMYLKLGKAKKDNAE